MPTITYNIPGTYYWTCPAGVTPIAVWCIGGGGGGTTGQGGTGKGQPGGGGGEMAYEPAVTVTPGDSYTIVVGAGGAQSRAGGDSTFSRHGLLGLLVIRELGPRTRPRPGDR